MTQPAARTQGTIFAPDLRPVTLAILMTVGLSAFEGLAVNAALPQVAADLGQVDLLPWVVSGFLLVAGVSTVVAGALVDRLGVSRVFRAATVLFVVGGVGCGLAPTMPVLVVLRVVQGVGGGAVTAAALTAVGLAMPRHLVGRAYAANATVWGVMGVAGPAIAAGMLAFASWRWIFLVNLPLGGAALALGWRTMPDRLAASTRRATQLNPLNVTLLAIFSIGSLVALDQLSLWSLPAGALALAAGALVMRRTRGRADALLAPRHVLTAPFGPLAWGVALLLIGTIGLASYIALYVSAGRGVGPVPTTWSVLFLPLGWTAGSQLGSRLDQRLGAPTVLRRGAAVVAPACALVGVAAALDWPLAVVFAGMVAAGVGTGASTNAALTILRELAPDAELGRATAAHQFVRSQGFAGGAALAGGVLLLVVAQMTGDVDAIQRALTEGAEGGGGVTTAGAGVAAAVSRGYAWAAAAGAGVAALGNLPLRGIRLHPTSADAEPDPAVEVAPDLGGPAPAG